MQLVEPACVEKNNYSHGNLTVSKLSCENILTNTVLTSYLKGLGQKLNGISQREPINPNGQAHSPGRTHVPPFRHSGGHIAEEINKMYIISTHTKDVKIIMNCMRSYVATAYWRGPPHVHYRVCKILYLRMAHLGPPYPA